MVRYGQYTTSGGTVLTARTCDNVYFEERVDGFGNIVAGKERLRDKVEKHLKDNGFIQDN